MTFFLVSLAVTFAAAPPVRLLMLRHGILDVPNHRSSHAQPTPRGGGLACAAGVGVAVVLGVAAGRPVSWPTLVGAALLSAVGFADDRAGLAPTWRLTTQVLVGLLAGAALGGPGLALAGAALAPAVVNAVNFMDGINGISALTITLWGATAVILSVREEVPSLTAIGALTAGASLGFLPWNVPYARLFLGDVGSYLLGGLVVLGTLTGWQAGVPLHLLLAPLTLYAMDTGWTLVHRAIRQAPLFEAHNEHVYQRLVGASRLPHVLVSSYVAGLSALVTAAWLFAPPHVAASVAAVIGVAYLATPQVATRLTNEKVLKA